MTNEQKMTACAEAAYEVVRVYVNTRGVTDVRWPMVADAQREAFLQHVEIVLEGDPLDGLSDALIDRGAVGLFVNTVRGMAAALGMKVTYPAMGDFPLRTIDWGAEPPTVTLPVWDTDTVSGMPRAE